MLFFFYLVTWYLQNLNGKHYMNPEHNLISALGQLPELKDIVSEELLQKMEFLAKPLKSSSMEYSYIDLRYLGEEMISDEDFELWVKCFMDCLLMFETNKSLIREVRYDG